MGAWRKALKKSGTPLFPKATRTTLCVKFSKLWRRQILKDFGGFGIPKFMRLRCVFQGLKDSSFSCWGPHFEGTFFGSELRALLQFRPEVSRWVFAIGEVGPGCQKEVTRVWHLPVVTSFRFWPCALHLGPLWCDWPCPHAPTAVSWSTMLSLTPWDCNPLKPSARINLSFLKFFLCPLYGRRETKLTQPVLFHFWEHPSSRFPI